MFNIFIHYHHLLFLKLPLPPRSARVRRFSRYEVSPHIPEHHLFRVQTKLLPVNVILYTFSPSLLAPTHTSDPRHHHISTGLQADHPHSYSPHAQTTSIYYVSPLQPCLEHPKDRTRPHFTSYPSETPHTSISPSYALLSPGSTDSQPALPMSQTRV